MLRYPGALLRREAGPLALCLAIGLAMSLLPNLIWSRQIGEFVCFADLDEVYMMALASQAYLHHPASLGDPVFASGGVGLYPSLPLVPGILFCKAFGLGPMAIDMFWRIAGGLTIPLAWYILARHFTSRRWVAAAMVAILLCDGGIMGGNPIARQAVSLAKVAAGKPGDLFEKVPSSLHREWRIGTPVLTVGYLLLHIWLVARARDRPDRSRIALSGIAFGLLFYVYPYYWTASGLALLIALALDVGHRRVYFWTGTIGGIIGLPYVLMDARAKFSIPDDWLIRSGKMLHVSRFEGVHLPIAGSILAAVGLYWTWTRRRDLLHLWALGAAGLIFFNGQVITGRDIENFHWLYVWGPALAFLALLLADSLIPREGRWARPALAAFLAVAAADATAGMVLRGIEASRAIGSRTNRATYRLYRDQRLARGAAPMAPGSVIAGHVPFLDFAPIFEDVRPLENYWAFLSPSIRDDDWDRRKALNVYLLDPSAGEADLKGWNWSNLPGDEARRVAHRLEIFRTFDRDLDANLDRYGVRYVVLPADRTPPPYLSRGWEPIEKGAGWQIWKRRAPG